MEQHQQTDEGGLNEHSHRRAPERRRVVFVRLSSRLFSDFAFSAPFSVANQESIATDRRKLARRLTYDMEL